MTGYVTLNILYIDQLKLSLADAVWSSSGFGLHKGKRIARPWSRLCESKDFALRFSFSFSLRNCSSSRSNFSSLKKRLPILFGGPPCLPFLRATKQLAMVRFT